MSSSSNSVKRIRDEDLFVQSAARPGWVPAVERIPAVGEEVYCVGGAGEVAAVLGKTGDGSRLLQIRLSDPQARPFFAASSNVLVAPV
ncbi:MAG TPA: hypothetical protein VFQ45_17975 [Longimicrobium sp.]|nr:hypothetical protein [Longimicrobium sp.]